jgi:hypothetical protein
MPLSFHSACAGVRTAQKWMKGVEMRDEKLPNNPRGNDEEDTPESRRGWKSKWVESTAPRADDPVDAEEMQGHNLLGNSSLRGGAIPGVSDPARDGHGAPGERADDIRPGPRVNPPALDEIPGD